MQNYFATLLFSSECLSGAALPGAARGLALSLTSHCRSEGEAAVHGERSGAPAHSRPRAHRPSRALPALLVLSHSLNLAASTAGNAPCLPLRCPACSLEEAGLRVAVRLGAAGDGVAMAGLGLPAMRSDSGTGERSVGLYPRMPLPRDGCIAPASSASVSLSAAGTLVCAPRAARFKAAQRQRKDEAAQSGHKALWAGACRVCFVLCILKARTQTLRCPFPEAAGAECQSSEVGVQAAMGCPWSTGLRVPGPVVLSTASASPQAAIQSRER